MIAYRPDGVPSTDDFGAFLPGPGLAMAGASEGPLAGLSFAAKDLFDVAGHVTVCGSPDWGATHPAAARSAAVIEKLFAAGASLAGKTVTDEISLGLLGRNRHYGSPVNPRAPDRYTGGSSSGSAAAVAAGLVPFALGSDTGGSMRVPSSYCGIYGIRPTHGAIPVAGLMAQAPSFDTAGFFAADPEILAQVGDVLLPEAPIGEIEELIIAEDAFGAADADVGAALKPAIERVALLIGASRTETIAAEGLRVWNGHHCFLQHPEFAKTFAPWVDEVDPRLSYDVAKTIANARGLPDAPKRAAEAFRPRVRERLDALLDGKRVLCLPTTPTAALPRDLSLGATGEACDRIVDLTCIAGLTGLPQISLPLATLGGLPIGLSLIGWRGSDRTLLDLARRIGASP